MKEKSHGLIKDVVAEKEAKEGKLWYLLSRLYGSTQLIFKCSFCGRQEAAETSGEQLPAALLAAGKAAREDRPEQARMLTSAGASFRLPGGGGGGSAASSNVLSLAKGTRDQPRVSDLDNIHLCIR